MTQSVARGFRGRGAPGQLINTALPRLYRQRLTQRSPQAVPSYSVVHVRLPARGLEDLCTPGVALVVSAMFGAMRGFATPLGAVMDAADRVAEGDYTVRVREYGPPPIRALARSFNTMTARLQDADRLRRDLMADVAHELRTPLTIVQGRLEGILDGVYARDDRQISQVLDETRVLSKLIEDLRTLALAEAGALRLHMELADMVGVAREVTDSMQAEAARKSVALNVTSAVDTVLLDVDALRIREVLTISSQMRSDTRKTVAPSPCQSTTTAGR